MHPILSCPTDWVSGVAFANSICKLEFLTTFLWINLLSPAILLIESGSMMLYHSLYFSKISALKCRLSDLIPFLDKVVSPTGNNLDRLRKIVGTGILLWPVVEPLPKWEDGLGKTLIPLFSFLESL